MFSLCRRYKDEHENGATQIKGGYMLRYKRKYLWNSWSEEWVVLYDDSTMAWFKTKVFGKPGFITITLLWNPFPPDLIKIVVTLKDSYKLKSCSFQQCGTLKGTYIKFYVFIGRFRQVHGNTETPREGKPGDAGHFNVDWADPAPACATAWRQAVAAHGAGLTTEPETRSVDARKVRRRNELPPPPHIELVMAMPYLRTAFKRPTVRVRPATSSEMYNRSGRSAVGALDGRGLVAVIKRQVPLAGQLDHQLSWGQGWGWVTLPNGVWSGRLTWSQEGEDFALHAMPVMHHTNLSQDCSMLDGVTAYEASAYEQALAEYDDSGTSDDWDFGLDCGDFMM